VKLNFTVVTVALVSAAALGLFLAFQNPTFLVTLLGAVATHIATAVLPAVIKAVQPKDYKDKQLDTIRQGGDPNRKRPREH